MNFKIFNINNPIDKEKYEIIYSIFEKSFPENERRTKENQLKLLNNKNYNILICFDRDDAMLGFMFFWTFYEFTYVEHFAVNPQIRNMGIGGKLLDFLKENYKSIMLEVEHPEDEICKRRIAFYQRHGFKLNDYEYFQPPMQKDFAPLPLKIMSYPQLICPEEFNKLNNTLINIVYKIEF